MEDNPQALERFIARQRRKLHLAAVWARLAGLQPGMVVVDFGSGPGILTQEYARLTGPSGRVYAVEQSAGAAASIAPAENVLILFQNYDSELNLEQTPDIVFLTDSLHHFPDPGAALRRIRVACGTHTRVLIAEYDPQAPGRVGAKLHRRIAKAELIRLIEAAGFRHDGVIDAEDEHYALLARC